MLKGFWKLTWIEMKVFAREPMGIVGSILIPVVVFIVLGKTFGSRGAGPRSTFDAPFNIPAVAALFIAISAVISLVAIISIYREGGILKRLRATPLSPVTILSAHVLVKLVFTVAGLFLLMLAGRQLFPGLMEVNLLSFGLALLLSTLSILSLGFVIASIVPTARFAQPISAAVLYPMIAISGAFFPVRDMPVWLRTIAYALPTTHGVALMEGIWEGGAWMDHWVNVLGLVGILLVLTALSTRVFRWE